MKNMKENKRETNENLEASEVNWYRIKIVEMVNQREYDKILQFIYNLLISFQKKWGI